MRVWMSGGLMRLPPKQLRGRQTDGHKRGGDCNV